MAAAAADTTEEFPCSTAEEWSAFFDIWSAAGEAYGLAEVTARLCAALAWFAPPPATVVWLADLLDLCLDLIRAMNPADVSSSPLAKAR